MKVMIDNDSELWWRGKLWVTTIASGEGDENFHNFENQVEFGRLAKLGGKFYESCWVRAIFFKVF